MIQPRAANYVPFFGLEEYQFGELDFFNSRFELAAIL